MIHNHEDCAIKYVYKLLQYVLKRFKTNNIITKILAYQMFSKVNLSYTKSIIY